MRTMLSQASGYLDRRRARRVWLRVLFALACVVVFCTTYALILPAITMEHPTCGLEEHTHTAACYTLVATPSDDASEETAAPEAAADDEAPASEETTASEESAAPEQPATDGDAEAAQVQTQTQLVCSYETLGVHQHTADCYDADGNLICGYADYVVHTHTAECYDEDGNLVCALPEIEAHTHTADCYTTVTTEGHVHTADCYTLERGELVCGLEEGAGAHTHTPECYDADGNLVCGLEESAGHVHTDECYAWNEVLTCTQPTDPVTTTVLTCDKPEIILHTHTDACYDEYGNLVCGMLEVTEHVHDASCYQTVEVEAADTANATAETAASEETTDFATALTAADIEGLTADQIDLETIAALEPLTCGLEEDENHTHTVMCYGTWVLTCGLEEHTHTDACYGDADDGELTVKTYEGDGYTVTASYTAEADIPDEAELVATEYAKDSDEYLSRYAEAAALYGWSDDEDMTNTVRLFNIGFFVDGKEVEPAAAVSVSITYLDDEVADETANTGVVHFGDATTEELAAEVTTDDASRTVSFDVASFSDFMVVDDAPSLLADEDVTISGIYTVLVGDSITIAGTNTSGSGGGPGGGNNNATHSWKVYSGDAGIVQLGNTSSATVTVRGLTAGTVTLEHTITTRGNSGGGHGGGSQSTTTTVEYYTVNVVAPDTKIKVYVYVAATGLSDECLSLLGIDSNTLDNNGYFPAGEIYLDASYFANKGFNTEKGAALINSAYDWETLLAALGEMNTSTLIDMSTIQWSNYSGMDANKFGAKDYTVNIGNHVGEYLAQAEPAYDQTWGSQHTALFHWHYDSSASGCVSYGFADQTVQYHLDLFFTTKTINFVFGNNGINWGAGQDGTTADTRTYITGSEIQEPTAITIPDGWYFEGYYTDPNFNTPWDGFGDPLNEDTTVYIKLTQNQVMTVSIQKEIAFAGGSTEAAVSNKEYTFIISTTDSSVAGESYITSTSSRITFSEECDSDGNYTATVTLTASTLNGVDGTVLIYGLPANSSSGNQKISYTVTEETSGVAIDGYTFNGVAYSGGNGDNSNTVTASGQSSTASSTVLATNTYEEITAVDIAVTKVDGTNANIKLPGAEFYLSKTVDGKTTYYKYDETDGVSWVNSIDGAMKFTSSNDGMFTIKALEDGSYTLIETKAPDGYVLPSGSYTFTVKDGGVSATSNNGITGNGTALTVTNSTGARLPETGGPGTTLLYTLGGLLLVAGAVMCGLMARRNRERRSTD